MPHSKKCLQSISILKNLDNCVNIFSTPVQYLTSCLFISRFVNIYLLVRYTGLKNDATGGVCDTYLSQFLLWIQKVKLCGSGGQIAFLFFLVHLSLSLCLSFPFYRKCLSFTVIYWWNLVLQMMGFLTMRNNIPLFNFYFHFIYLFMYLFVNYSYCCIKGTQGLQVSICVLGDFWKLPDTIMDSFITSGET